MPRRYSTDDLAALRAIRPVIADAHAHPGRAAAIAALDRIADQGLPERTATLEPPTSLLDVIQAAWPSLFPDRPFERTPVVEALCAWVEQLAGDPAAAAETRVSKERGKPVIRREDPPGFEWCPWCPASRCDWVASRWVQTVGQARPPAANVWRCRRCQREMTPDEIAEAYRTGQAPRLVTCSYAFDAVTAQRLVAQRLGMPETRSRQVSTQARAARDIAQRIVDDPGATPS